MGLVFTFHYPVTGICYTPQPSSNRLIRLVEGKILVDFLTKANEWRTFLCEEVRGEIKPPKDYKGKLKFFQSHVKAPDEIESGVDKYFIIPEMCADTWWPDLRPRNKQVRIRKAVYVVGLPLPAVYYNQEK